MGKYSGVILLAQIGGLLASAVAAFVLIAPCGIPWRVLIDTFGETSAILVVVGLAGGFTSGVLVSLHMAEARWRLLLLLVANPMFLLFTAAVVAFQCGGSLPFGVVADEEMLVVSALFLALGTMSAALGDWYGFRRAKRAGIR